MPLSNPSQGRTNQQAIHRDFSPAEIGWDAVVIGAGATVVGTVVDVSGMRVAQFYVLNTGSAVVDVDAFNETNTIALARVVAGTILAAPATRVFNVISHISPLNAVRFLRVVIRDTSGAPNTMTGRLYCRS